MNNRQTSFRNNEWIRQKTNIPLAQYPPNVASTYNMRPPYRPLEKFDTKLNAKCTEPEASRFNSQFNETPARQTSNATGNFASNQNASYFPRLTQQTSYPSYQANFQNSQDMNVSRHETQTKNADIPTSNQFSKIPCNLASVLSSDKNDNTYSPISNVRMQSVNPTNVSAQHLAYRHPPANQIGRTMTPPSNNNNFIRYPPSSVSNTPEFIRQPNSNASTLIRPPPSLVSNVSGFIRPPFPQGFSNLDAVRHAILPDSSNPNPVAQSSIPGSGNPGFVRQPSSFDSNASTSIRPPPPLVCNVSGFIRPPISQGNVVRHAVPPDSINLNPIGQSSISGSGNPDFVRQQSSFDSNASTSIRPPPLVTNVSGFIRPPILQGCSNIVRHAIPPDSSNFNSVGQFSISGSGNLDFARQPPPLDFNKSDFTRQPPPLNPMIQPPSSLQSSNIYIPNNSLPSGNFPCTVQIPPALPIGATPPLTIMKQDSHFNIVYGPDLSMPPPSTNQDWLEENKINNFLQRFAQKENNSAKPLLTVTEFRSKLKDAFATVSELVELKASLLSLLDANENKWNEKLKEVTHYKDKITKDCNYLSQPKVLNFIKERLESKKKKRDIKKKIKANKIEEKTKKLKARAELHQTADKWLESIKEKNLKLKREAEMKREADSILAEVRRKINEAKRTIDKLKVFEKLRSARHANAVKKGLFLPDHDERFKIKISELKATLFKQLSDYESEEKALKVMLEAEQEGQLEEEALWRIRKLKATQQRRQKNIIESLFGNEEVPTEEDPMFLFYQFQNSGNKSIENLVQIRHQWDLHINQDGEAIPTQWVVPIPPNNAAWEVALEK